MQKTANFFAQIFTNPEDPVIIQNEKKAEDDARRVIRQKFVPNKKTSEELFDANLQIAAGPHFEKSCARNDDNVQVYVGRERKEISLPQSFLEFGLDESAVLVNVRKRNYKIPTQIQMAMIPLIQDTEYDIFGQAQTGSGKTAAFMLPIIDELHKGHKNGTLPFTGDAPYVIITAPTKELVRQLYDEALAFSSETSVSVAVAYGDMTMGYSIRVVRKGCDILVTTIGRLMQYSSEEIITFSNLKYFVIDEADRFLQKDDMLEEMRNFNLFGRHPHKHRTIMMSATFDEASLEDVKNEFMAARHCSVYAGAINRVASTITQKVLKVQHYHKRPLLIRLLKEKSKNIGTESDPCYSTERTIVFKRGRRECDRLGIVLAFNGFRVITINRDRTQQQRADAVEKFTKGIYDILIGSDLVARGMNFPNVAHVINYDLPSCLNFVQFVHKVGRTGRAGNEGRATSFFDPYEDQQSAEILAHILEESGQEIPDFLMEIVRARKGEREKILKANQPEELQFEKSKEPRPVFQGGGGGSIFEQTVAEEVGEEVLPESEGRLPILRDTW